MNLNRFIYVGLVILLFSTASFSQNQNSVWCFGDSAGIDFSNLSAPVPIHSNIKSRGSAASISDGNGNLLFSTSYNTDILNAGVQGGEVYDRNNQIMPNGDNLKYGGWYQEALIIPFPGDSTKYYIFHIGVTDYYGLYYSTVDITLNGGFGDVVQKNVQLNNLKADDGMTAVKHGNGRDWWVLFRHMEYPNNEMWLFLVTPQGVQPPVVQNVGTITQTNSIRYDFSPIGNKLSAVAYSGLFELYDFDRCSGTITLDTTVTPMGLGPNYERVSSAFSPNQRFVYISTNGYYSYNKLIQFDLQAPDIALSADTIWQDSLPFEGGGYLGLAPDQKIYWSCSWSDGINFNYPYPDSTHNIYTDNLSVINFPDSQGVYCNFTPFSFYLGGNRTYYGLPNNPNYAMPALSGSPCDSLTSLVDLIQQQLPTMYIAAGPQITFINANGLNGKKFKLRVYDMLGKINYSEDGKISSQFFTRDLSISNFT
ncbi:MAG: hypothetical protein ACKO0X_08205, partial [Bacteroidota bacterium]